MSFFTALRQYAINRLEDIGTVDLLIGIPCYNDDQTVAGSPPTGRGSTFPT
jgi:hypothetical protein